MAFDIIGDIHGHADTLEVLLRKLGYVSKFGVYQHPEQRKVTFVGDYTLSSSAGISSIYKFP